MAWDWGTCSSFPGRRRLWDFYLACDLRCVLLGTSRLNGILVFAIALIVWALELTGMPHDWFYRSSIFAVAGGTLFATIFAILAVFSQPQGKIKNPIFAPVGWSGPRVVVLQQPLRHKDVPVYRRWDDVGAQRPVRGRVPLRILWRRIQSRRLPLRSVLYLD